MSSLIGNKEKFAIQYEITEVVNQFIYGHICYWIDGIQIGDFDSSTIISDVLIFLPQIIKDKDKREDESFFRMEKERVCYLLGGQAYLDDEKYEEQALNGMWARFDISIDLDVFSDTMVKLIDYLERSRIVFVDNEEFIHECYLKKGIVDDIFYSFYNEFNDLYEKQVVFEG